MKNICSLVAFLFVAKTICAAPPNVLFIVVDDMNCALSCYGHPGVQSPNLDRLAARGVRFDRAYANYPVCNASRTSFLSGRRPETTQVFTNGRDSRTKLGEQFQFLPEYFRWHGYHTIGVGKIQHTPEQFDSIQYDSYEDPGAESEAEKKERKVSGVSAEARAKNQGARGNSDEQEADGIIVRKAAKLLESPRDKPLFLAVGLHRPHGPRVAPQKYFDLYPLDKLSLLDEPSSHLANIPTIANPPQYNPDWNEKKWRAEWQTYFACVSFMDAQVGVLLDAMDRLKLWDNTIVIYFSDHGSHLGEHGGFWGKQSLMEESVRVPLIVSTPNSKGNVSTKRLVELIDVFPTLTDLCGLPMQAGVEGTSFAPLLAEPELPWKKAARSVVLRNNKTDLGRSIRTERFTYIEWPDNSKQLYDYATDPREYHNLAFDPQYATTMQQLAESLRADQK
jgi:iduronate 2-sulfatase